MHTLHPSILRAYDIRGIVGETLSAEDAYAIGRSIGSTIIEHYPSEKIHHVCVGFDGRLTSPMLEEALVKGLLTTGITVTRIGVCPSPMLYFAVKHTKAHGGVMVTGSHNPPSHNGFKMMIGALPFYGDAITALGKRCSEGQWIKGNGSVTYENMEQAYIENLLGHFDFTGDLKPLSIAWDPGHGAVAQVLTGLLEKLPGSHIALNNKVDGTFPAHHPDPSVPENMQQLIDTVTNHHCDLGIAFDGDGDRIGVVDHNGRIIWNDQILILFAETLLKTHPGATIIADAKASQVVFDKVAQEGGNILMCRTGHSFIKMKMHETGAVLAGEMSGHIFFKENHGFDDALYAALMLIHILMHRKQSLTEFIDTLPTVVTSGEIRIDVPEAEKFALVDRIQKKLEQEGAKVCTIDGVRVTTETGWWIIRASNTQAALTLRCDADSTPALNTLMTGIRTLLHAHGVIEI